MAAELMIQLREQVLAWDELTPVGLRPSDPPSAGLFAHPGTAGMTEQVGFGTAAVVADGK